MDALLDLRQLVVGFFLYVKTNNIEIYNEFSLQHELGIFLRKKLQGYRIQFERNVSYFIPDNKTIKKEIDITIFNEDKSEKYAIELKCPLNGQYPEQMYSFVKDIKFTEELKSRGFTKTATVTLVSDRPFYEGRNNKGIYKFFREEHAVYGSIFKPTGVGKNEDCITLSGRYDFIWQDLSEGRKYYIIEI
ncbi:hypothetical protein RCG24_11565 [Neobacillus sp. OS1-32]|uniref:hypothetical protein n=1 Tax=Neobacillus sp. OS1-32 TaxID=3070682 RepID=UPI0027E01749|nr:hypothetical protein [Neobacillus sp. OS1-32]WML32441.1 hypothetical protein RCG24_11565 [Neobacillus sp. OS1-32]